MRLLLANLSHYWRRPAWVFWNLVLSIILLPMIINAFHDKRSISWFGSVFWIMMYSGMAAKYQLEICSKPFSFCLPRYHILSSNTLLAINLFWSILGGGVVGLYIMGDPMMKFYWVIIMFLLNSIMFYVGVFSTYIFDAFPRFRLVSGLATVIPFIFLIKYHISGGELNFLLDLSIAAYLLIACGMVCYFSWCFWCRRETGRKLCGTAYMGLNAGFNIKQIKKLQQKRFAGVAASVDETFDIFVRFFLRLIEKYRSAPIYSVISGMVYQSIGPGILITLKERGLGNLAFLGLICFFGFYPIRVDFVVWLVSAMIITGLDLRVHSTLLLIRGRMERYVAAIVSLLVSVGIGLVHIFILLMVMRFLMPVMPVVHLYGHNFSFHVVDWQLWPIFVCVVPIVVMLRLIFGNKPVFLVTFMGLFFPFSMIASQAKPFDSFMQNHWNPTMTGLLLVCVWAVFAAYLYRVCFYKDLGAGKN